MSILNAEDAFMPMGATIPFSQAVTGLKNSA